MPKYKMLVMSSPVDGREDDFNEWYQAQHLGDVTAVPGFVSAQRFKLAKVLSAHEALPYLSIYDIEAEDLETAIKEMRGRARTHIMPISDALARGSFGVVYEEAGPIVRSTEETGERRAAK
jgi:hypothetical protein